MRTAAILPVKRFERAKARLAPGLPDRLRGELARAMVSDVLLALAGCEAIERTIVVSGERSLPRAQLGGAAVLEDKDELGQSAAVAAGIEHALAQGAQRVLCIPGDCPALDAAELDALLTRTGDGESGEAEVVIVPDRHGTGTNGLLLCPPRAIAPSFGPGSCQRHIELAHRAGVRHRLVRVPSLQLDIDTASDLEALVAALEASLGGPAAGLGGGRARAIGGRAEHTRVLLSRATGSGVPARTAASQAAAR
ncbi:MAG: 2-phospho-L-lactate guanylyltransferase [Actinobacteria bacterium]|nr:MAG: 2-phospho-L-lactate guanylyltransferase [Actinomycetota bacterium]